MEEIGKQNKKLNKRNLLWKLLKATFKSIIVFLLIYIPWLLIHQETFFLYEYGTSITIFTMIMIFFIFANEITSDRIFQYAFNFLKAIIIIAFFFFTFNYGKFSFEIEMLKISVDISFILVIFVSIELLELMKTLLGAINFLSQKVEDQNLKQVHNNFTREF